jgi:hypothetical protein
MRSAFTIKDLLFVPAHGDAFGQSHLIPASAIEKAAPVLSFGQIDMDRYINRATKIAGGNPLRGAQYF